MGITVLDPSRPMDAWFSFSHLRLCCDFGFVAVVLGGCLR
jgi:hypothetical protein